MRGATLRKVCVGAGALAAFASAPAAAQSLGDDYWIEISAYRASIDTRFQVSSSARQSLGTEISGESDLGLDERELLPVVHAGARLGGDWTIGAEVFTLRRDSINRLARDIVYDDVTYPASASVTTGFDTDIYRFTIGYAVVRNPELEIGGALGLHVTDVEASLAGEGRIGDAAAQIARRSKEVLAPLPTLGLFASYRLAPRLTVAGRVDYLSLRWGDYDGRLINAQAGLSYRLFRHLAVGVAYRLVYYRVGIEKERYTGRFAYEFSGPTLFVRLGF